MLLYFGAEWLVKGASEVALKLGISPLVVGLTVVAFGTSMPELLVCLKANSPEIMALPASWMGFDAGDLTPSPDIPLGNIVGSDIFNIALILGVSAMIRPIIINAQLIRRELPIFNRRFARFCRDDGRYDPCSLGRYDSRSGRYYLRRNELRAL